MASTPFRVALTLAIALLGALPALAFADLPERKIVGGQPAAIVQAPWQVALVDTSHSSIPQQFCGGSILDATHVVTAAHCLASPSGWTADEIYAGTTLLSDPQQVAPVGEQRLHPGFSTDTLANDVAVLTLATPLTLDGVSAQAVQLATQPPAAGAPLLVSGWGDASNGQGFYPNQLRAVTVHAVADTTCSAVYGLALVTDLMLCAGEPEGGKDSCSGDSGGPLVDEGTNVLVGIVSFGYQCALAGYPGIYTEVAATPIRSFVQSATGATPDPAPVAPPQPQPVPQQSDPPPAPVLAPQPTDTTPPVASVRRGTCTRTACTIAIRVTDPGFSRGVRGVEATVRSQRAGYCRLHHRPTRCVRTTAARSLQALPTGLDTYSLRATRLPAGAVNRFSLVASDNAGQRQLSPTVVRLKTRRRGR